LYGYWRCTCVKYLDFHYYLVKNYKLLNSVIFEKWDFIFYDIGYIICPAVSSHNFQVKIFSFYRMLVWILNMCMCKGFYFLLFLRKLQVVELSCFWGMRVHILYRVHQLS
jgi:hypothetical protein